MSYISDYKKKNSTEDKATTNGSLISDYKKRKNVNIDTFNDDLNSLNGIINENVNKWQSAETMGNTKSSMTAMLSRLNDYNSLYGSKLDEEGKKSIQSTIDTYNQLLSGWDSLTEHYGQAKDAESYEAWMKKLQEEADKPKLDTLADYRQYMSNADFNEKAVDNSNFFQQMGNATLSKVHNTSNPNSFNARLNNAWSTPAAKYAYLTDDERKMYYYLLNTQGEEASNNFLKSFESELNARRANDWQRIYNEAAEKGGLWNVAMSIASVGDKLIGGASAAVGDLVNGIAGNEYDANAWYHGFNNYADQQREAIQSQMSGLGSFLYGTGMSIADNVANIVAASLMGLGNSATLANMGLQAYASRSKELYDMGASDSQIVVGSILSGAIEIATEKMPLENLFKAKGIKGVKAILKETAKQMAIEAGEEGASSLLNDVVDLMFANGGESEIQNMYEDYVLRGYTHKEALSAVFWDRFKELGLSMLGGALSGGVMGGVANTNQYFTNKNTGNRLIANNAVNTLNSIAKKEGVETAKTLNPTELGGVYQEIQQKQVEDVLNKKNPNRAERYADYVNTQGALFTTVKDKLTGNSLDVNGIRYEDGNVIVETSKGTKNLDDITAENTDFADYSFNDYQKKAFAENYNGGNLAHYADAFNAVYMYGANGMGLSRAIDMFKRSLSLAQIQGIYEAAKSDDRTKQREKNKANKEKYKAQKGGNFDDSVISYNGAISGKVDFDELTQNQKANVLFAKAVAKITKANVKLFDSRVGGQNYNGQYDANTNTIYLDLFANPKGDINNGILTVLSHELTHWAADKSALYTDLKEAVLTTLAEEQGITTEELVAREIAYEKKQFNREIGIEEAIDELVAKACEDMLSNSSYAEKALGLMSKKNQKNFIGKMIQLVKDLISEIKSLLGVFDAKSNEAKVLRSNMQKFEEIKSLWEKMLKEATENTEHVVSEANQEYNESRFSNKNVWKDTDNKGEVRFYNFAGKFTKDERTNIQRQIKKERDYHALNDLSLNYSGYCIHNGKLVFYESYDDINPEIVGVVSAGKAYDYAKRFGIGINDIADGLYDKEGHFKTESRGDIQAFARAVGVRGYDSISYGTDFNRRNTASKSNTIGEPKRGIKFALKDNVEETKDLIAVHNMHEEELIKTLELGGFPMPSIAIMKAADAGGNSQYGEYSIVFDKNTIDPKNKDNKVYSGDAWTPSFPVVYTSINYDKAGPLYSKMIDLERKGGVAKINSVNFHPDNLEDEVSNIGVKGIIEKYKNDISMKQAYLAEQNKQLKEMPKKIEKIEISDVDKAKYEAILSVVPEELQINRAGDFNLIDAKANFVRSHESEIREALKEHLVVIRPNYAKLIDDMPLSRLHVLLSSAIVYKTNGKSEYREVDDISTANKIIDSRVNQEKYEKWLNELFEGIEGRKGIRNTKDLFTSSGNRRSWEALHDEVTLDNIVKAMKSQTEKGEGIFGAGNPTAAATYEFTSIDDIRSRKDLLKTVSEEEYSNLHKAIVDRFSDMASRYDKRKEFGSHIDAGEALSKAMGKSKTKAALDRNMKADAQWFNYSEALVDDVWKLMKDIQELPTGYFEAKPRRAVNFNEIAYIVAPNTINADLLNALEREGIEVKQYEEGNEENRLEVLNSKPEVRFSMKDSTGNTLTEEQAEYFSDSKIRDSKGNLKVMYHVSPNDFTVFDVKKARSAGHYGKGFYFSDSELSGYGGKVYECYLNITNPISYKDNSKFTRAELTKYVQAIADNEDYGIENYGERATVNSIVTSLLNKNKFEALADLNATCIGDYVAAVNLFNEVNGTSYDGIEAETETVAFSPEQIKLTTNQKPTDNPDIRYSWKDADGYVHLDMNEKLSPEDINKLLDGGAELDNQKLKRLLEIEKQIADEVVLDEKKVSEIAKGILKDYRSTFGQAKLEEYIKSAYMRVKSRDTIDLNAFREYTNFIAKSVLEESPKSDIDDYNKALKAEIREYLKGQKIKLDAQQKADIKSVSGLNWNQALMGKAVVSNDGTSLDSIWSEMLDTIPDFANYRTSSGLLVSEVNPADEAVALWEVLTDLNENKEIRWTKEMYEGHISDLSNTIYNGLWDVAKTETLAEKYDQKIANLKRSYDKKVSKIKAEAEKTNNEKLKAAFIERLQKLQADNDKEVSNLNQQKEALLKEVKYLKEHNVSDQELARIREEITAEMKQKSEETKAKFKDAYEAKVLVDKITEKAIKLNNRLKNKDGHVPDKIKTALIKVLDSLDFYSKRYANGGVPTLKDIRVANEFNNLKKALEDAQKAQEEFDAMEDYFDFTEEFIAEIGDIAAEMDSLVETYEGKFHLRNLDATTLKQINEVLNVISHSIYNYDKALNAEARKSVNEMGADSIGYLKGLGSMKPHNKNVKRILDFINWGNVTPIYVFDRFGEGGKEIFRGMMKAADKLAFNSKDIIDYAKATFTSKQATEWSKEIQTVVVNGQEYNMTTSQIMSLYLLDKREAAQQHLYQVVKNAGKINEEVINGEGIVIGEGNKVAESTKIKVTKADVQAITSLLTKEQKDVADALQKYMTTTCADWGNYVSMKRFGIMQFLESDYMPMKVYNEREMNPSKNIQNAKIFRLLNQGFTKTLNEKASGALVLQDVFSVFAEHAQNMAVLNAYGLPVLDMYRWLSFKVTETDDSGNLTLRVSLKEQIKRVYGSKAINYIRAYLEDINGGNYEGSELEGIMNKLVRNYKAAAVAGNIRVAMMQPMSVFRAMNEMDPKYIAKAYASRPSTIKGTMKLQSEQSGISIWKNDLGNYDNAISQTIESQAIRKEDWKNKAMNAAMFFASKADEITWGYLYRACQLEISDTTDLTGEEYNKAVADRFSEIIHRTQVVDSVNTRTELMRRKDFGHKMWTAFMSEPSLSYSMLESKLFEFAVMARDKNTATAWKKYGPQIIRAGVSFAVTTLAVSLAAGLPDLIRDDTDDKWIQVYLRNVLENMFSDATGMLPVVKDLESVLLKGYNPSRMDEEVFNSVSKTLQQWTNGKFNIKDVTYALKAASQATGIPVYNLTRDFIALWNKTVGELFPSAKIQ